MHYSHTQKSYVMILLTVAVAILFVWVYINAAQEAPSVDSGPNLLISLIMLAVVAILASFTSLRVQVSKEVVELRFGYGIFKKKFMLADIESVKGVKNPWYYGWGIHFWPKPKMWIFNVSGFDAVEIALKNGNVYRIGTDEPEKLRAAIAQQL